MNKATTELKIEVSGGRICIPNAIPDGKYRLVLEEEESKRTDTVSKVMTTNNLDDVFILIEASKLSLDDGFMTYRPGKEEYMVKDFKKELTAVIKKGVADFYRPRFDPSFANNEHTKICYKPDKVPAIGKSYNHWVEMAKNFCPERESRICKKSEYIAFCGWLIKKLVENGWSKKKAWNAVCTDSKDLGHYWNSENAKDDLEFTKTRGILDGLVFDLANTFKLLADDDEEANMHWIASGNYEYYSYSATLVSFDYSYFLNDICTYSVGLLVLSK